MYSFIIAAIDDFLNRTPPFDELDDRTLADIGVDRHGRPVDSNDQRFNRPIVPAERSKSWISAFLTMGLLANWER
jgi:hypothetical protein